MMPLKPHTPRSLLYEALGQAQHDLEFWTTRREYMRLLGDGWNVFVFGFEVRHAARKVAKFTAALQRLDQIQ